jgi:hypothetical protein
MIDYVILNAACANGACPPQAVVSASYVLAPQVVVAAPVLPGKTVVKYKRGLFGRLIPTYAEVTTTVAEAKAEGKCKGNCK